MPTPTLELGIIIVIINNKQVTNKGIWKTYVTIISITLIKVHYSDVFY